MGTSWWIKVGLANIDQILQNCLELGVLCAVFYLIWKQMRENKIKNAMRDFFDKIKPEKDEK